MTPVRLEPAAPRSRVKHSTTEPLHSLLHWFNCMHERTDKLKVACPFKCFKVGNLTKLITAARQKSLIVIFLGISTISNLCLIFSRISRRSSFWTCSTCWTHLRLKSTSNFFSRFSIAEEKYGYHGYYNQM